MHPLYQDVCSVLAKADSRQGTLKRLCLAPNIRNKKATLALASETFRYAEILQGCFQDVGIVKQQNDFQPWMIKVLVYEVLIGQGKIKGGGAASRFVKEHQEKLQASLQKRIKSKGVESVHDLLPAAQREAVMPRYARVNTLKMSVLEAIKALQDDGFRLEDAGKVARAGRGQMNKCFALDETLSDVILFPHGTDIHDHPLVSAFQLRLQDKASCFPAHVLADNQPSIKVALDACSAPGNKTTHLSALMDGAGKLIAVELDKTRAELLRNTVAQAGAQNIEVISTDFLAIDPKQEPYCTVEAIMLDPSCSGSGIVGRSAKDGDGKQQEQRRQRLCEFQKRALQHALRFPNIRRVVYSTCSVHREENEDVVSFCLNQCGGKFELETALPSWHRRGEPHFEGAERCVRVAHEDLTQGFFVACFSRVSGKGYNKQPVKKSTLYQIESDSNAANKDVGKGAAVNTAAKTKKTISALVKGTSGRSKWESLLLSRGRSAMVYAAIIIRRRIMARKAFRRKYGLRHY